ncbi:MAG: hypothetical protein COZ18_10955 [Flexibacter sp. CG_4_10_14_3_um_filter_32_15]|nr:MAG: hypothetical protein COZ18_10955 [Flexibacter sp. CG_4_10_14_3_um_filter_32_15]
MILFFSTSFKPNLSKSSQDFQNQPRKIVLYIFGDTNDATIRQGVEKNITNITSFFEKIAQTMGSTLTTKKFTGSLFSSHYVKNNVRFQLTTRNFGENPIIIFYYVGHGVSSPNSEFPLLSFSHQENYPLKDIEELITNQLSKSTHWVIAETCNSNSFQVKENGKVNYPRIEYLTKDKSLVNTRLNDLFKRNLFLYSATKDKKAYINNQGGVFLNHFLETGNELLKMPSLLDLDNLLNYTERKMATTKIKLKNSEVIQDMGYEK